MKRKGGRKGKKGNGKRGKKPYRGSGVAWNKAKSFGKRLADIALSSREGKKLVDRLVNYQQNIT
jgi:hypothetical protein